MGASTSRQSSALADLLLPSPLYQTDEQRWGGESIKASETALLDTGPSANKNEESPSTTSIIESYLSTPPENSEALTVFLLLNTMIGTGILNQPYVFRESGVLGGLLGFILSAVNPNPY
jgi:hypothetical protein